VPAFIDSTAQQVFHFRALDPYGNRVTIEVLADSANDAKVRLIGQNYHSLEQEHPD